MVGDGKMFQAVSSCGTRFEKSCIFGVDKMLDDGERAGLKASKLAFKLSWRITKVCAGILDVEKYVQFQPGDTQCAVFEGRNSDMRPE